MPESKSKSESANEAEPKREPREPRALSAEYHKARKQLMLWAGILFIWELVGIDLEKAKEAGGNFGAIIGAIKSPQAVPWALLILVGYFLFKVTVEWYQCSQARRDMRVAKIDFTSAWIVSLMACVLYIGQTLSRVQFADLLRSSNKTQFFFLGFFAGSTVILLALARLPAHVFGVKEMLRLQMPSFLILLSFLTLILLARHSISSVFVFMGLASGLVFGGAGSLLLLRRRHRSKRA